MIDLTRENVFALKAPLAARVRAALGPSRDSAAVRWWWVPGRVEVFGKHTDYGGGPSLMGALSRGFLVAARPRADGIVRVADAGDASHFQLDLATGATTPAEVTGWRRYVNILARRLARDFPDAAIGADLALMSDLPRASGMSSSSALCVGVAHALVSMSALDARPDWQAAIPDRLARGGYFACLENGLSYGPFPGDGGLGTFGGSEDQTAILCCRPGALTEFTYMPVRHVRDVALPASWRFVLASSGVTAEKAGRAQGLYNRASLGVRALIDLYRREAGPIESLTAALAGDASAEPRLRQLIDTREIDGFDRPALHRRLEHFVRERPRVSAAATAIARADREALGRLSAASHADADALLANQIPETNALAALARAQGAFAASAFGAGFGGSVWALIDVSDLGSGADGSDAAAEAFGARWLDAYRAQFPARTSAACFVARPGEALTEIDTIPSEFS